MINQLAIIQLFSHVIINDLVGHFGEIVMLCHCYWVSDNIVLETFVYQLRCGIHLFMHIHQSVFVSGCCCFCAIDLIDLLRKLCYSGWVSVFQFLLFIIFHCVSLSGVLNGVLPQDHWYPRCHHPRWCYCRRHPWWWYCDWHPRRCNRWHFPK